MTTKHTISDADALARFEEGIDPDTATVRDRSATADIRAAVQMRDNGQQMVDDAVTQARHSGLTWVRVAAALGVSPQAARKKYLRRVAAGGCGASAAACGPRPSSSGACTALNPASGCQHTAQWRSAMLESSQRRHLGRQP